LIQAFQNPDITGAVENGAPIVAQEVASSLRPSEVYTKITREELVEGLQRVGYRPVGFRLPALDERIVNTYVIGSISRDFPNDYFSYNTWHCTPADLEDGLPRIIVERIV
jgi:hypothetical protein